MKKKLQLKVINPVPNIDLLSTSLLSQGFQDKIWKKYIGFYFEETYSTFKDDFLNWHVHFPFWQKLGKAIFNKIYKDRKFSQVIYTEHKKEGQALFRICDEILNKNIRNLSNAQIRDYLKKIFFVFHNICIWGTTPIAVDFENNYLSGWLENIIIKLTKKYKMREPVQEILSILTTPQELAFFQKERIDLLKLASQKNIKEEVIKKHCKSYNWVDYGYIGPAHPLAYYEKRMVEFKKSKEKPIHILKEMTKERMELQHNQQKLSKKLHLNAKARDLFQVARDFMFLKVYRKEMIFKAIYVYDLLFKELGERVGFSVKQFHYMTPQEIIRLLNGYKIDKKEINPAPYSQWGLLRCRINRRINSFFTYTFIRGKSNFYYGIKARNLIKNNLYQEKIDKTIREFTGMSAFLGKARGVVKIVNTASEMKKVKKGDILVSIATNPSIVPAMKLAAAFVTDTGGITCHAAIVARELKKPCVIGTKIATKVLKDGDMVEVDAFRGVVKKL